LFDDVHALFVWLTTANVPLALITNGASDTQRNKLHVLGIADWFDAIVISGEVGVAKPDPWVFNIALTELAVGPEKVWHIGDNLATDVAGAKASGITSVWLNRCEVSLQDGHPIPDLEVPTLSYMLALLTD